MADLALRQPRSSPDGLADGTAALAFSVYPRNMIVVVPGRFVVKMYLVTQEAHERGYGSPDEILLADDEKKKAS